MFYSCSRIDTPEQSNASNELKSEGLIKRTMYTSLYNYLGSGYDVTQDYANESSTLNQVIDVDRFKLSFNDRVLTENPYLQESITEYGESAETFSKMISNKIDVGLNIPLFKGVLSSSFSSSMTSDYKFDAKYIYGSYNLIIKQKRFRFNATADLLKNYLTAEFTQDLQSLTPQQIVQYYGTHVLTDIFTGAKLEVKFQSETTNEDRAFASQIGIKTGMKDIFNVDINNNVSTAQSNKNYNKLLTYRTRGGDPSLGLVGQINLDQSNPIINISNWQNSSSPNNSVLVDFGTNGLIIIYDLVADPVKRELLKSYVDKYLIDNQVKVEYLPTMLYGYQNQPNSDHYFSFDSNLQPSSYWTNEGPAFKVFKYKAPNTVPIYGYKSTSGAHHYFTQSSTIQPTSYWNIYMGVAFYAYSQPGENRVPIYNYKAKNGSDHYLTPVPDLQPTSYWYREGIAFYAPAN